MFYVHRAGPLRRVLFCGRLSWSRRRGPCGHLLLLPFLFGLFCLLGGFLFLFGLFGHLAFVVPPAVFAVRFLLRFRVLRLHVSFIAIERTFDPLTCELFMDLARPDVDDDVHRV